MSVPVQLLINEDGLTILVPGDDPTEIHRQALEYADEEDLTVDRSPAEIEVRTVRVLPVCRSECHGCSPDREHHVIVPDGTEDSFRAAFVACHVFTNEERAAREAAIEANRCETEMSWLGIDLGRCHGFAVVEITFTCGRGCERAPQRVCAMHRDGAIETTRGITDVSVCRTCEQAGREDVPIRLLSCKSLTTEDLEVSR